MIEIATLRAKLQDKRLQAFLRVIRAGESHETDDEAYKALYGWRRILATLQRNRRAGVITAGATRVRVGSGKPCPGTIGTR